ncbi:MAG: plasmid pRiA4b ORF-3 family protein [Acetobacteraceae bacterium]|nr:plasmid pRiA4b ORF-3 family protein [Acetobacteraceae bacterium]
MLNPRKTTIEYMYDFGDSWEHRLTVTHIRPGDPNLSYPRYIRGERNGPPEDCGGIPGFYAALDARADPSNPDHDYVVEWLDGYDPDVIDELPLKYALGRIASRRNAARKRLGNPSVSIEARDR